MRETLGAAEQAREEAARSRAALEAQRTDIARRLGSVRVEMGKLDGDLALAAERLANAASRRLRATDERNQMESRAMQSARERQSAEEERTTSLAEHARIQSELAGRSSAEELVRQRLTEQRSALRTLEEAIQRHVHTLRSLEGERTALESDLASLRERESQLATRRSALQVELESAEHRRQDATAHAERQMADSRRAAADADRNRHQVGELRRQEALDRSALRDAEELVAQLGARRQALEDLERDRVGLAPGAAALLAARDRFEEGILGPLSDFIDTGREDAMVAERLLGEWVHAVLIRDRDAIPAIQRWHAESQTGAVVLLPVNPGPAGQLQNDPMQDRLEARGPASAWVRALLGGSEVLESGGRMLRRANGAILLSGAAAPSGPLRRRAELQVLGSELERARIRLSETETTLQETIRRLGEAEAGLEAATSAAEESRMAERLSIAAREDAVRLTANLTREHGETESQHASLVQRIDASERRLAEIDAAITEGDLTRAQQEESLGTARAHLASFELEQESARESRVHWQVQEAHVAARVQTATERYERAIQMGADAELQARSLVTESHSTRLRQREPDHPTDPVAGAAGRTADRPAGARSGRHRCGACGRRSRRHPGHRRG